VPLISRGNQERLSYVCIWVFSITLDSKSSTNHLTPMSSTWLRKRTLRFLKSKSAWLHSTIKANWKSNCAKSLR
jgi:hypothetical protein